MKRKDFKNKESKVVGTTKIKIKEKYRSPIYRLEGKSNASATETGLVTIAELNPEGISLPKFIFRWDTNSETVDIDIYKNGENAKYLWKKQGYEGHKTKVIDHEGRVFEVNIEIPSRNVFKGTVDVGLQWGLKLKNRLQIKEHVDVKIVKEKDKRKANNQNSCFTNLTS